MRKEKKGQGALSSFLRPACKHCQDTLHNTKAQPRGRGTQVGPRAEQKKNTHHSSRVLYDPHPPHLW